MTTRTLVFPVLLALLLVASEGTAAPPRSKEKDEERAVELILDAQKLQEAALHDQALKLLEEPGNVRGPCRGARRAPLSDRPGKNGAPAVRRGRCPRKRGGAVATCPDKVLTDYEVQRTS